MIYLACPYLDDDATVRELRFHAACRAAAALITPDEAVFCPVIHAHPLARRGRMPEWAYYGSGAAEILSLCTALYVLQIPGWDTCPEVLDTATAAERMPIGVFVVEPEPHEALRILKGIQNAKQA